MPGRYVLALDQGTTGSTALVVDAEGAVRARGYRELPQYFPRPGWVEHDPEEIWQTQLAAVEAALAAARVAPRELAAIGITNQRETTILWERASGRPVHRAIVWQCRRSAPLCERMRADGLEPLVRERTGLVCDAYFSGTKIAWLLEAEPGLRPRAARGDLAFGTVDAWLLWKLTGGRVHATDASNASRTLCLDIHRLDWDPELTGYLRIPREVFPTVRPSSGVFGETADLGVLPAGIPVAGIAGDQQAALFGQACHAPGAAKNTYGTGCFALLNTGSAPVASRQGLLTTIAWQLDGRLTYALEGSVFVAGAALQWLRDGLGIIREAAESETLAGSVPDTGGVYFVPAFVGLGAPYWDMYARGTIVGLTRGTTRAHLARAALEAIGYQSRDVLEIMAREAGLEMRALRVDGLGAGNDFLCQFQSDIMDITVERPEVIDTTALGAAYLAGLGVGLWRSLDAVAAHCRIARRFTPAMEAATRQHLYGGWQRAVERARGWAAKDDLVR
ncbi:MAG TPA: glycerol kinase GlpK [Methylomirabilota bacterium]|jgi:glycerol kinase|nr:glycerol kinase GlpK [Methylomirabilota bacterium]